MGATKRNHQYPGDCNHVKYTYYAIYFLNTEIQYIRRWDFRQMKRGGSALNRRKHVM